MLGRRIEALYDRWQVRRVRAAYTSVSRQPSPAPDYEGMVAEMRAGFARLARSDRDETDRRVLGTIFFGQPGLAAIRFMARRWPEGTARLFARATPVALRFLVGEVRYVAPRGNHLPDCRFRREGGEQLCEQVCRRPTQDFCARHSLPIVLEPRAGSCACDWRWGETPR